MDMYFMCHEIREICSPYINKTIKGCKNIKNGGRYFRIICVIKICD